MLLLCEETTMIDVKDEITVKVTADTSELDQITEKAERFCKLMNEAMEIADSIAHANLNIRLSTIVDDSATELASITTE